MSTINVLFLLSLLLVFASVASGQEYVVVVHKDSPIDSLSAKDIKRIFLGKNRKWPDGSPITIILNPQDKSHAEFTRELLRKSPRQLMTYWRKNLYSGQGMLPHSATDAGHVQALLANNSHAISYLSKTSLGDFVKALEVIE